MKYYATVEKAVNLVVSTMFANGKQEDIDSIRARVYGWYANTDCTDPEVLAACALFGPYYADVKYRDMLDMRDWWFPQDEYEDLSEYINTLHVNANLY